MIIFLFIVFFCFSCVCFTDLLDSVTLWFYVQFLYFQLLFLCIFLSAPLHSTPPGNQVSHSLVEFHDSLLTTVSLFSVIIFLYVSFLLLRYQVINISLNTQSTISSNQCGFHCIPFSVFLFKLFFFSASTAPCSFENTQNRDRLFIVICLPGNHTCAQLLEQLTLLYLFISLSLLLLF